MAAVPPATLDVAVPDYVVKPGLLGQGLDSVEIPGGGTWFVPGEPWVPFYSQSVDVPAGTRVQAVSLLGKTGVMTETGIYMAMTTLTPQENVWEAEPFTGTIEGWFPEVEYDWSVVENPDGSSTLMVNLYPVQYNPLTTDLQFFKNWSFAIGYVPSTVQITSLVSVKEDYEEGEEVRFDLDLDNDGEALDVVIEATVQQYGSEEIVAGLPLRTLAGLAGPTSIHLEWDSGATAAGLYLVEVSLKDSVGNVLDNQAETFHLGISSAEITGFEATPRVFDAGDRVDVLLRFENTGTVELDGTAIVRVQNEAGETVETLTQAVADLAPGEMSTFNGGWQTSGDEDGTYTLVGYLLYEGKSTDVARALVGTEALVYLPLVSRNP